MAVTLKHIAEEANVTVATVSLALRGRNDQVSDVTIERIKRIARHLDYHPNAFARGLATNKSSTIGVALWSIDTIVQTYFSHIISNIVPVAAKHDYSIQYVITDDVQMNPLSNIYFVKKVKEQTLEGLIIIDQCVSNEGILWLKHRNVPFVLIDRYIAGEDVPCVRVDNVEGLFIATKHLIDLGHRRIAFLSDLPRSFNIVPDKLDGYRKGLSNAGIPYDEEIVFSPDASDRRSSDFTVALERFLKSSKPPTALVAGADRLAAPIIRFLADQGIKVPDDMAVVGYNDDPSFTHFEIGLTTVAVPLDELGKAGAEMLFRLISGSDVKKPEIVFKPNLIVRDSCGGAEAGKTQKMI